MHQRTMLLIASNALEVHLIQWIFAQVGPHHTLRVVGDGEEALAYLLREGAYTDPRQAPPPDVIVHDLPLPPLGGLEVVQRLKQDPRFQRVPIIVLGPPRTGRGHAPGLCRRRQCLLAEARGDGPLSRGHRATGTILVRDCRVAVTRLNEEHTEAPSTAGASWRRRGCVSSPYSGQALASSCLQRHARRTRQRRTGRGEHPRPSRAVCAARRHGMVGTSCSRGASMTRWC